MSALRKGNASRLCIVSILTDDHRRESISANRMTLQMGVETRWRYADQKVDAQEGVCGGGGKRALGVKLAALLWVVLR